MSRKKKQARQKKSSKAPKKATAKAAKAPGENQPGPTPAARQRVRRQLVVLLVLLLGGGYGLPRWLLQFRGHFTHAPKESANELYQRYQSKARWIKTIGKLPGHRTAAADAMYGLRRQVIAAYKQRIKQPQRDASQERRHLVYVAPDRLRRSSRGLRRLCKAPRRSSLLAALIHPKLNLYWNEELARTVRMDAMSQGHVALAGRLSQRQTRDYKGRSFWTFGLEQTGVAMIAAGRLDQAAAFWKARSLAPHRRRRPQMGYALCGLYAHMGRDNAAARSSATARCRAIRAWALARKGRIDRAWSVLSLPPGGRLPVDDGGVSFLVRSALLAHAGRWEEVLDQWRQWRRGSSNESSNERRFLLGRADVLYLFNPIFTHRVPPSLLAALQRLVAAQLQRRPTPGLMELMSWLLVRRGRQAILLGQPVTAKALLQQALRRTPDAPGVAVSLITLAGFWRGPEAAMEALKRHQTLLAKHPRWRRRRAILEATYAAQRGRWSQVQKALAKTPCGTLSDEHQGVCRLLRAELVRRSRKAATSKNAKVPRFTGPKDRLVRLLLTPARLRSPSLVEKAVSLDHPDLASPALRARMLLMQLLDGTGQLTTRQLASWHCKRLSILPTGHLLVHYLRLRKRHAQHSASKTKATPSPGRDARRRLGRAYSILAELWLNHMAL